MSWLLPAAQVSVPARVSGPVPRAPLTKLIPPEARVVPPEWEFAAVRFTVLLRVVRLRGVVPLWITCENTGTQ